MMVRHILYICVVALLAVVMPVQARAQDVLGTPRAGTAGSNLLETDEARRVQYGNLYYNRCALNKTPGISGVAHDDMCMCHTVHMVKHLRTEELQVMGTGKGLYEVNKKRLYPKVYGPCMEFIIRETEEQRCYDLTRVKDAVRTQEQYHAVCQCVGQKMAEMVRETAEPQLEALMQSHYQVDDPYEAVMNSSSYLRERSHIITDCMRPVYK
jgi:hypothetical protein